MSVPAESGHPKHAHDITEVHYSVRALLVAMAVVAVMAAALGTLLRQFPSEVHERLLVYWAILTLSVIAFFVFHAWRRYQAELLAGRVLYRLAQFSDLLPTAPDAAMAIIGTLCVFAAPAVWVGGSLMLAIAPGQHLWLAAVETVMVYAGSLYAVLSVSIGITYFWWRKIRLCERGLVIRDRFIGWGDCRDWYWRQNCEDVLVLDLSQYEQLLLAIPAEKSAELELLLDAMITRKSYG